MDEIFSTEDLHEISDAITIAETNTSGEIRVHIESKDPEDPLVRAREMFYKLKMDKTKDRNGVLIYIAFTAKKFAIYGDEGIHSKVGHEFWQEEKYILIETFKAGNYTEGLVKVIHKLGEKLQEYFPYQDGDINELSNEVVIEHN